MEFRLRQDSIKEVILGLCMPFYYLVISIGSTGRSILSRRELCDALSDGTLCDEKANGANPEKQFINTILKVWRFRPW